MRAFFFLAQIGNAVPLFPQMKNKDWYTLFNYWRICGACHPKPKQADDFPSQNVTPKITRLKVIPPGPLSFSDDLPTPETYCAALFCFCFLQYEKLRALFFFLFELRFAAEKGRVFFFFNLKSLRDTCV